MLSTTPLDPEPMLHRNTLLVPVDIAGGERVAHYAATLAARSGARLLLLHVLDSFTPSLPGPLEETDGEHAHPAQFVRERTDRLAALADEVARSGADVETRVVSHLSAAEAILAVVDEVRPAAVVMGTHARGTAGRFVLGSVAAAVVRRSHAPVLTVRVAAPTPDQAPRRVLVGVDLSPLAVPLVRAVAAWVHETGGVDEVVLCHAVEGGQPRGAYGLGLGAVRRSTFPRSVADARNELDHLVARWWEGPPVRTVALDGPAGRVLLGEAGRTCADLVVVATHGWRGVDLMLVLGSVANRVIRQAACPVLTFTRVSLRRHGAV